MLSDLAYRLRSVFRRKAVEQELDEELRFHLEQHAAKLASAGMPAEEANRLARLALEGPEQVKERCRDERGIRLWEAMVQDFWQAFRQLKKSPAVTITIVATLALCIGANAAVYSIVDALFFRPLPYPHPKQLVMLVTYKGSPELDTSQDGFEWEAVRDHATLLEPAAYGPTMGTNLATGTSAAYIRQQRISADLFHVLGMPLYRGREFTRREDVPNGPALAIMSYGLWQRVFHADPKIEGRSVILNGVPHTVVGVASAGFRAIPVSDFGSLEQPDIYTPIQPSTEGEGSGDNYGVIARLKPGVSIQQADAQLKTLTREIRAHKGPLPKNHIEEERVISLQSGLVYDIRTGIHIMWTAVILVLVIGCINIAGLLLAQSGRRSRELAMRCALGASRFRILQALLIESMLLAFLGAGAGVLLGRLTLQQLLKLNPDQFGLLGGVPLDARVLLTTGALSFCAALLFGFFPALEASRVDLRTTLGEASRTSAGRRRDYRRHVLVFAEVSLGVILITSAGLLVQTLLSSTSPYPGFNTNHLLVASASLSEPRYAKPAAAARLFRESTNRIEQIPGVQAAAVAMSAPYTRPLNEGLAQVNGQRLAGGTELNYVTPGFFKTLGVKLLGGRWLTEADYSRARRVVLINETFVHFYLRDSNPVGSVITFENQQWSVAGVVNSVQEDNHLSHTVPVSFYPEVYILVAQFPEGLFEMANRWFSPVWLVRTTREDAALPRAMQKALASVDPRLPFAEFRTIRAIRAKTLGPQRYRAWVVSAVSGLAVILAALGIYGLVAQSVSQRTREMGIRMALGADVWSIIRTCTAPAIIVACAGVVCGLIGAAFAATLLKGVVWNVSRFDPRTYALVGVLLIGLAFVASLLPALRLRHVSPARVLQEE